MRAYALLSLFALAACKQSTPSEPSRVGPDTSLPAAQSPARARGPAVVMHPRAGGDVRVEVEVARTPAVQERGLMFRRQMDEDRGMIFVFPEESHHVFWMHNTYIPLDMVFIRADRTILGIVENATPETDTSREVPGNSMYVLEVNGGYMRRHHLAAGDRVDLIDIPPAE